MGTITARSQESQILTVDVHQATNLLRSGHRYLDVRTEEEFRKGHVNVKNCINVPYLFFTPEGRVKNPKFVEQVSAVCDNDEHLVVGCLSGVRSAAATTDLLNAGFKNVCNMGGGYTAWLQNNFSVKESEAEL